MRRRHLLAPAVTALVVGLVLCQADRLQAATFSVDPIQLFFSAKTTSALVSLRNESDETVRFQLTAAAWDQGPNGEMNLSPTQDIVFYPQLLTLSPREERKIRVGTPLRPGPVERTYRLFIEELPPSQADQKPGTVKVLTKMGIPIFVQAAPSPVQGEIRDLTVRNSKVSFTVANTGIRHFVPEAITVQAIGADGQLLKETSIRGWYILGGGIRRFELESPAPQASAVVVGVRAPGLTLSQKADVRRDEPAK